MNLEALLKYQKADLEYKKLNDEVKNDPNYKKMKDSKEAYNAAKQKGIDSEAAAESVLAQYDSALAFMNENAKRVEELCVKISAGQLSAEEEAKAVAELEELKITFSEWEKKASQLKANAEKALSEYATAQKGGKTARAEYETAKAKYEEFKKSKEGGLAELKSKRDALASGVDEKLMGIYKQLTGEGKYPAFVAQLGDEKFPTCGACGMMLSDTAKRDLNANGYCRCETCHRIIYKP